MCLTCSRSRTESVINLHYIHIAITFKHNPFDLMHSHHQLSMLPSCSIASDSKVAIQTLRMMWYIINVQWDRSPAEHVAEGSRPDEFQIDEASFHATTHGQRRWPFLWTVVVLHDNQWSELRMGEIGDFLVRFVELVWCVRNSRRSIEETDDWKLVGVVAGTSPATSPPWPWSELGSLWERKTDVPASCSHVPNRRFPVLVLCPFPTDF